MTGTSSAAVAPLLLLLLLLLLLQVGTYMTRVRRMLSWNCGLWDYRYAAAAAAAGYAAASCRQLCDLESSSLS
jgi:hypothetical protein